MQEADDAERERVAAVLEQLRAGVRQRRAELATLGSLSREGPLSTDGGDSGVEMQGRLLALRQSEYVREPVPTSHRQGLGRWIVLVKKAGYQLFGKWLVRPLLEQQNAFNQATSVALQELAENEERLARQVRELQAQLEALRGAGERRPGAGGA